MPPKLTVADDVISEILDGEAVLLNLKTGTYFSLNPSGSRIWQLIEQLGELTSVRDAMLREFEVRPECLDADLESLLKELEQRGLISRAASLAE